MVLPRRSAVASWVLLLGLLAGCAGSQPASPAGQTANQSPPPAPPKRLTAAASSDFAMLTLERSGLGNRPGLREVEQLVHAGLTIKDNRGVIQPRLAEAVPSAENGFWTVFPDGRMETRWRLRENTVWQDGTPLTTEDLLFTARVAQDRELPEFRDPTLNLVESIEALDSRTLLVRWKQPYIDADTLFGASGNQAQNLPLPRHLLEPTYLANKAGLADLTYWSEGFVGAGPYAVREWLRGSQLILEANPRYVLGRPKVDVIEVRFFADPNALYAAVLANAIDVPLGPRAISFEQAVQLQGQWKEGDVQFAPSPPIGFWPQLHNPNPAVIGNARFRQALLHAMNREEMANTLGGGRTTVAHAFILPNDPDSPELERRVARFDYDPRRAGELIDELGYSKGSDGFYRDGGGRLTVEIRSSLLESNRNAKLAVADYWQRVGVAVNPVDDPDSRRRDIEYRATFPGFETRGGFGDVSAFRFFHSAEARTRENSYLGGSVSNYMNPQLDGLIDRFFVTIPHAERVQLAGQILQHLTEEVIPLFAFYNAYPTVVSNRVRNVAANVTDGASNTWNAHEWDRS